MRPALAYRTVSELAVMVIAGSILIVPLARERKRIYLRREEQVRETTARKEANNTGYVAEQLEE